MPTAETHAYINQLKESFELTSRGLIPPLMLPWLEERKERYTRLSNTTVTEEAYWRFSYPDSSDKGGLFTFSSYRDDVPAEKAIAISEISHRQIAGIGEVRFCINKEDDDLPGAPPIETPFVSWTQTMAGFERRGLGRRRILAMEAAALAFYGCHLHSGEARLTHAPKIWARLAEEGLAEEYIYRRGSFDYSRFKFI